jgi:16S rRNA (guanine527-N7)-methyltransferase
LRFADELERLLPDDLPNRGTVVEIASRHLELIVEANRNFNLTRILDAREAAIKHVLDSVLPWKHFENAAHVVDAGTGAGFPGIPLAAVLPHVKFTLAESIGKKARFVDDAVDALALRNVDVAEKRAEDVLRSTPRPGVLTARAVAPIPRAVDVFGPALKAGWRALLYKGPDAEAEIGQAQPDLRKRRLRARVLDSYALPDDLGFRTVVEVASSPRA